MANFIIDPNMGFANGIPGVDPGPDYATNQFNTNTIIGAHNHSNGSGVPITPGGLNINSDFPINGNNLTLVKSVEYVSQGSPLAGASPFLDTTYFSSGDFYVNDGAGNQIQITKSGALNATSSGISSGSASAAFSGGVLVVDSATNTPANIQVGSVLIGNILSGSNFATLQAPSSLGANYSLTLPPSNSTGGTTFMTIDASNNMGEGPALTAGITSANIANATITGAKIVNQTLTQGLRTPMTISNPTASAGNFAVMTANNFGTASATPVTATGFTVTITTTGRPVMYGIQSSPAGSTCFVECIGSNFTFLYFLNSGTVIYTCQVGTSVSGTTMTVAPPCGLIDTTVAGIPGTYTYTVQLANSGGTAAIFGALYAFEI